MTTSEGGDTKGSGVHTTMTRAGVAIAAMVSLGMGFGLATGGAATAGAAQSSNPLGPTLAQIEVVTDQLVANVQNDLMNVVGTVQYEVYPEVYCLVNALTIQQFPCDPND